VALQAKGSKVEKNQKILGAKQFINECIQNFKLKQDFLRIVDDITNNKPADLIDKDIDTAESRILLLNTPSRSSDKKNERKEPKGKEKDEDVIADTHEIIEDVEQINTHSKSDASVNEACKDTWSDNGASKVNNIPVVTLTRFEQFGKKFQFGSKSDPDGICRFMGYKMSVPNSIKQSVSLKKKTFVDSSGVTQKNSRFQDSKIVDRISCIDFNDSEKDKYSLSLFSDYEIENLGEMDLGKYGKGLLSKFALNIRGLREIYQNLKDNQTLSNKDRKKAVESLDGFDEDNKEYLSELFKSGRKLSKSDLVNALKVFLLDPKNEPQVKDYMPILVKKFSDEDRRNATLTIGNQGKIRVGGKEVKALKGDETMYILVMDEKSNLFLTEKDIEGRQSGGKLKTQHNSPIPIGSRVFGAATLQKKEDHQGKCCSVSNIRLNNYSGHYRPDVDSLFRIVSSLQRHGADLDEMTLMEEYLDGNIPNFDDSVAKTPNARVASGNYREFTYDQLKSLSQGKLPAKIFMEVMAKRKGE
jgi:hypothetical protein